MSETLSKIFGQVAEFTHTMAGLHNDFLSIVQRDINRFLEKTNDLQSQMNWQGYTVLGLTSLSASLAIGGALIPKAAPAANTPAVDPRLNTNAGIASAITQKLSDHKFLRTTCKTASKFFNGVVPVADAWYRGTTTELESKKTLLQTVNVQDGQSKKSMFDQQAQQAQQAALRLLESKAKGG